MHAYTYCEGVTLIMLLAYLMEAYSGNDAHNSQFVPLYYCQYLTACYHTHSCNALRSWLHIHLVVSVMQMRFIYPSDSIRG